MAVVSSLLYSPEDKYELDSWNHCIDFEQLSPEYHCLLLARTLSDITGADGCNRTMAQKYSLSNLQRPWVLDTSIDIGDYVTSPSTEDMHAKEQPEPTRCGVLVHGDRQAGQYRNPSVSVPLQPVPNKIRF